MRRIKQYTNRKEHGHLLLSSVVGLLCILYLATTGTPEDQRFVDALEKYCYAHYAVINRPTPKNESRFMSCDAKLARLSKGKFNHRDPEEVRAFLEPGGYAYEMEDGERKVEYFLARFTEHGHFEASGTSSSSYEYFLLDRVFVYPLDRYHSNDYTEERNWSPLVFYARDDRFYLDGGLMPWILRRLFTRLWESKGASISKIDGPRCYNLLYRGLEEIWEENRPYYFSEKIAWKYFFASAYRYSLPVILACISREHYYRERNAGDADALELAYLRSLMEDPSFITLGIISYAAELEQRPWAQNVITALETEELEERGLENCSLEWIRWAAKRAFELKREDLV
jgi:hypothetical protein